MLRIIAYIAIAFLTIFLMAWAAVFSLFIAGIFFVIGLVGALVIKFWPGAAPKMAAYIHKTQQRVYARRAARAHKRGAQNTTTIIEAEYHIVEETPPDAPKKKKKK